MTGNFTGTVANGDGYQIVGHAPRLRESVCHKDNGARRL